MTGPASGFKPRKRLFWRIYLYGLLFCAALACVVMVMLFIWEKPPQMHLGVKRLIESECMSDPARLRSRLNDFSAMAEMSVAVYSWDGTALVTAGPNPPRPLSSEKARALRKAAKSESSFPPFEVPVYCAGGIDGYMAIDFKWRPSLWPVYTTILIVFCLLAAIFMPLARTIARPLEQITDTARILGNGDFSARTGIKGSDEIGVLAGTFDEMAERLERLLRSERELLANISHEIRTPLARIHLAVELCDEKDMGIEALRGHLKGIVGDLAELDRLIDDVLMATRLELESSGGGSPGFVLRAEVVGIESIIREAALKFGEKWAQRNLEVAVEAGIPDINADPAMLRRALDNLLDNAARYSGAESPIVLAAAFADGSVRVEVRDRGIGIGDEDMQRVFEPFFRTDRARSRHTGGFGLGLALCKKIVEAHGGRIEVVGNAGSGSIFRINLEARS
ncbi:MAG: HAMP domain-containing sensor histidine kinase [Myxococcota bacterium]|jgi:signal transduction histidine kinase